MDSPFWNYIKMFSIKNFFSKCDQIRKLRIWPHLLKKSSMENFIVQWFVQLSGCSNMLKYYNNKGKIIKHFLLFLVPCICFLFEPLKLNWQFSSRFYEISGCSNMWKYCNIFQRILSSSKLFLSHVNVSYFATLHQRN